MSAKPSPIALHKALDRIWGTPRGWGRLSAVNHTVIGKRFFVTAFVFFAIGGVLSMMIRAQLATPRSAFLGPDVYNQVFTMHGTVMMFLFAIPMFEGLAMYLLPKLIGARDLAFPRLSAFGYWCYLFGGSILILALIAGVAPDAGWFLYTPLSSSTYTPGINSDVWLLGITFVEISAVAAAVEITVTVLKMRAPGMRLERMPIFAWYILITALMMVIGFPPLILGSILLELERAFDLPFFDPTRGGDALLWQHLFWLFGHPEVYIIFLPAAGAVSTILPVFAQHALVGYRAIVIAIIALAFLSFGLWVHHMFTVGIPHMALAFFSAASALVAIPTAVQFFAWLATLAHGRPRFDVPMLYIFGFFIIFILGGLTGVMLAMVPFNWQVHDTHFVVAHLHYVLVGGFVFPMLAATYYWLPHVSGRLPMHRLSVPAFWLIFAGFNLTFFMMHLTGLRGMPRRVYTYPAEAGWEALNLLSSVGGFMMTIGFALVVIDIATHYRFGRHFRRDPWKAATLDWAQPTPPPSYNFASLPSIDQRADGLEPAPIGRRLAAGEGYLGFARNGWMETLGVDTMTARPNHVIILPNNTYLPFWSAAAICGFVLALLFKFYWLSLVPLGVAVVLLLCWTRVTGSKRDMEALDIGRGETAPAHWSVDDAPSWWAMLFTLVSNATLFASLLFGMLFLWLVAPEWPPVIEARIGLGTALVVVIACGAAAVLARHGVAANRRGERIAPGLALIVMLQLVAAGLLSVMAGALPDPTSHAQVATTFVILAYLALHSAIGALLGAYCLQRLRSGKVAPRRGLDLRIASLWQDYVAAAALIGLALLAVMPVLIAGTPQ